jgi:hypothetical protein
VHNSTPNFFVSCATERTPVIFRGKQGSTDAVLFNTVKAPFGMEELQGNFRGLLSYGIISFEGVRNKGNQGRNSFGKVSFPMILTRFHRNSNI